MYLSTDTLIDMLLLCRGVWKRHFREAVGWLPEVHWHQCEGRYQVCSLAVAIRPECTCQGAEGQHMYLHILCCYNAVAWCAVLHSSSTFVYNDAAYAMLHSS